MPARRYGEGPAYDKDGARMKKTFTGKDRCYLDRCTRVPNHVITFFGRKVWVCKAHTGYDSIRD
jgi:hypothetical protein